MAAEARFAAGAPTPPGCFSAASFSAVTTSLSAVTFSASVGGLLIASGLNAGASLSRATAIAASFLS